MFSLLCRIHCCSMLVAQFIRVEFGLSRINHKWYCPNLMTLAGRNWRTNGSQCGCLCQNFLRRASSWWNVPAQEFAQNANVHKLISSAHFYANANVQNELLLSSQFSFVNWFFMSWTILCYKFGRGNVCIYDSLSTWVKKSWLPNVNFLSSNFTFFSIKASKYIFGFVILISWVYKQLK